MELSPSCIISSRASNASTFNFVTSPLTTVEVSFLGLQFVCCILFNLVSLCSLFSSFQRLHLSTTFSSSSGLCALGSPADYSGFSGSSTQVPVVDVTLAVITVIALTRLFLKNVAQLSCHFDICVNSEVVCYLHGFLITFLQHFQLWVLTIFIFDRDTAHFSPHSYLRKCSHCLLYLILVLTTFLLALHFTGPIYGFSSYRFNKEELSCGIDWHSPYSCPYWSYTALLVLAPVLLPLAAKTVTMAYKWAAEGKINSQQRSVPVKHKSGHRLLAEKLRRWLRIGRADGAREKVGSSIELSPLSPESSSAAGAQSPTLSTDTPFNFPRLSVGSTSALCVLRSRSCVLKESREVPTCLLVSLFVLLAICPRLLFTFKQACLQDHIFSAGTLDQTCSPPLPLSSPSGHSANQFYTFYVVFIEEFTHTVLIPFTFLLLHPRMRFAGTE